MTVTAKDDTIHHYGYAGYVNIQEVKDHSYHENGSTAFLQIKKGRVVLENSSKVTHIHIERKNDSSFDNIIVSKSADTEMPVLSRDPVTIGATSVLVVEVETLGSSQYVWLEGNGTIEDSKVLVSSTLEGEKTAVTESTAADYVKQVANSKDGDEVVEGGKTPEQVEEIKAEVIDELAGEEVAEDPNVDNYVARIGATGYESFKSAVDAATEGQKIYLLKDFSITETIGELTYEGFVNGLQNEVVLTKDITIIFEGASQLQFNEGGLINVNGYSLRLGATTENAGLYLVEIDEELQTEIDESGLYLTVIGNNIERIQSATLSNYVRFNGTAWETSGQIGVGGADVVGPGDPPSVIWG